MAAKILMAASGGIVLLFGVIHPVYTFRGSALLVYGFLALAHVAARL